MESESTHESVNGMLGGDGVKSQEVRAGSTMQTVFPRILVHRYGDWTITISKAPIMSSQCMCPKERPAGSSDTKCVFCRNETRLTLNHLPDMVFVENSLRVENTTTHSGIEFNAVDAVNSIGEQPSGNIQVASANVWQESRAEALKTYGSTTVQYDWTYTPDYRGTIFGGMRAEPTTQELDLEMLKRRDDVLLFDEIELYGDELDDNGCSELDIKIRIVDAYMFVLMRFYLRVDHVFVRLYDTRLVLKKGDNFMLREYSLRECRIPDLPKSVSPMDPMQIWSALNPVEKIQEKLKT